LDQTFQDFEIVIVDDASIDETTQVVEGFRDPRIRYFRHDTNRGESGGRNTGLQHATGEYIAFLDDDDIWLSQKLAMQVDLLENSPTKVGAVYASFLRVDAETREVLSAWIPEKRGDLFPILCEQNWIGGPSTVVLRRQCFDTVGRFDEQLKFGPDYDMWIRISRFYEFEYIKEPLVFYSVHGNRMSTNYALMVTGLETLLKKYETYFSLSRNSYSYRLRQLGVLYCYRGDIREGRAALFKAIQFSPLEIRNYYNMALSLFGVDKFKKIKTLRDKLAVGKLAGGSQSQDSWIW
jgi:glycosyltransferase involved in cell wall biosynthesis